MEEIFAKIILCLLVPCVYYADIRHRLNKRTARRDLDAAAKELGLKRTGGDVGSYQGRVGGYSVKITADDHTKITVMLKSKTDAWLMRTNWFEKMINGGSTTAPWGNVPFSFADVNTNRFFHYRFAPKKIAETLVRDEAIQRFMGDLAAKWRWTMGDMTISIESITASPSRGTQGRFSHSITGRQLKYFLPDLVALAKMWDELPELN